MSDTMSPFAAKKNIGTHVLAEKSVNIGFESIAVQEIETRDELLRIESEAPRDFRLKDVLPFANIRHIHTIAASRPHQLLVAAQSNQSNGRL